MNDDVSDNYLSIIHLDIAGLFIDEKEMTKALPHAVLAHHLFIKKYHRFSFWTLHADNNLQCVLVYLLKIYYDLNQFKAALFYLHTLDEMLSKNNNDRLSDDHVYIERMVFLQDIRSGLLHRSNDYDWRHALTQLHTSLRFHQALIDKNSSIKIAIHQAAHIICESHMHAPDLALAHSNTAITLQKLAMTTETDNMILFDPSSHDLQSSIPELAVRYTQLAEGYNGQVPFESLGLVAKMWAIDYGSMAMELLDKTGKHNLQLAQLEQFIQNIKQTHAL